MCDVLELRTCNTFLHVGTQKASTALDYFGWYNVHLILNGGHTCTVLETVVDWKCYVTVGQTDETFLRMR